METHDMQARTRHGLAGAVLVTIIAIGCHGKSANVATLSVAEVAELIKNDGAAVVCDANGPTVRSEYGVIPGAVLLPGHGRSDIAAALPETKDAALVFYCSSSMCSAAPRAANRAVDAGYTDVYVMPEGIKGWVQAGQPVDRPSTG